LYYKCVGRQTEFELVFPLCGQTTVARLIVKRNPEIRFLNAISTLLNWQLIQNLQQTTVWAKYNCV
jgi:hypothetical protein